MKHKFCDLRRVKRGEFFPDGTNDAIRKAIAEHIRDQDAIDLLDKAEKSKWYGKLEYPADNPKFVFTFRYGVCQSFTSPIVKGKARFVINVVNDTIDFGKAKE